MSGPARGEILDCDSSSSVKARLSVATLGALDCEVAAKTMPPFGSVEAPDKYLMNQWTMASSCAWIGLSAGLLYAESFIRWARPSTQRRRRGRPGRDNSWRMRSKIGGADSRSCEPR